jgi:hypothetical protein
MFISNGLISFTCCVCIKEFLTPKLGGIYRLTADHKSICSECYEKKKMEVSHCPRCCWFCDGICIKENPNCDEEFFPKKEMGAS